MTEQYKPDETPQPYAGYRSSQERHSGEDETTQPSDPEWQAQYEQLPRQRGIEEQQRGWTTRWPVSSWPYALLGSLLLAVVLAVYRSGGLSNLSSADLVGKPVAYFVLLWVVIALARKMWTVLGASDE